MSLFNRYRVGAVVGILILFVGVLSLVPGQKMAYAASGIPDGTLVRIKDAQTSPTFLVAEGRLNHIGTPCLFHVMGYDRRDVIDISVELARASWREMALYRQKEFALRFGVDHDKVNDAQACDPYPNDTGTSIWSTGMLPVMPTPGNTPLRYESNIDPHKRETPMSHE